MTTAINTTQSKWRILWVIPPLVIGIVVLMMMAKSKQSPQQAEQKEIARAVRVITVPSVTLTPQATGYGTVQPAQIWTAVAQVAGRIIEMHPKLRDGEIIPANTLLFRIDPVDYELSLAQAKAELAELEVRKKNTQALLSIEQRSLTLAQREHKRLKKLVKQGTLSQSQVDEAERATLNVRTAVQNLKNTLALIPSQRLLLQAKQSQTERNLARTRITAPFNLRVANLAMETDQYVSKGQTLFSGDFVDQVEVIAQVSMSALRHLLLDRPDPLTTASQVSEHLSEFIAFKPVLRMDMDNHMAQWQARFVRFDDRIDSQTRTIGVVVAVDDPLAQVKPGLRPPLSKGMFVQVLLQGHVQPERIVLPRSAIRAGKVYIMDAQQRLQTRKVSVLFNQGFLSVIENGIHAGETIVVSDLIPAVDGMLLQAQVDEQLQQQLQRAASGDEL
ncbi:efflux RND transporter periplasmic adaptor subunit [Candidatus Venteria ishoeyi]|uniref:Multidrug resistance protein MdtA n=1 Tax=Candidatus Venteria ishoeyi TaxID=1899563 RepID=A0A1H6F4N1_9GAMM|nr:efflux RND transporter periplasmic adaptor subunit [Candidatus Venteria ishoeyi]MDM8547968.1 efflux RND transporter periplasmic adaptor subunit [Candidatus Venteria ishoeyi]SEH05117.1 Multidrug resistance protein MdtA precursor [Candidatus Venteria ishoeyi]